MDLEWDKRCRSRWCLEIYQLGQAQVSGSEYHSLLVCLVMTNIAVEVEHSFMTFLAQSGLQDKNMY